MCGVVVGAPAERRGINRGVDETRRSDSARQRPRWRQRADCSEALAEIRALFIHPHERHIETLHVRTVAQLIKVTSCDEACGLRGRGRQTETRTRPDRRCGQAQAVASAAIRLFLNEPNRAGNRRRWLFRDRTEIANLAGGHRAISFSRCSFRRPATRSPLRGRSAAPATSARNCSARNSASSDVLVLVRTGWHVVVGVPCSTKTPPSSEEIELRQLLATAETSRESDRRRRGAALVRSRRAGFRCHGEVPAAGPHQEIGGGPAIGREAVSAALAHRLLRLLHATPPLNRPGLSRSGSWRFTRPSRRAPESCPRSDPSSIRRTARSSSSAR